MSTHVQGVALMQLRHLVLLQTLNLRNSHLVDEGLAGIAKLTALRSLNVGSTAVTDKVLVFFETPDAHGVAVSHGLENLVSLNLQETRIKGPGLVHLAGLPRLRTLSLSGSQITDEGLAGIEGLVDLRSLDLSGTAITDKGLFHLKGLKNLHWLDLSGDPIAGEGLADLADLPALEALSLRFCKLTDENLAQLQKLPKLARLTLQSCHVSDAGLRHRRQAEETRLPVARRQPDHGQRGGATRRDETAPGTEPRGHQRDPGGCASSGRRCLTSNSIIEGLTSQETHRSPRPARLRPLPSPGPSREQGTRCQVDPPVAD